MYIYVNGEWVSNPDAFNCHFHTFGLEYASQTLAGDGMPNWVLDVNLPSTDWVRVTGSVLPGDAVIYMVPATTGPGQAMSHSGRVIGVDSNGRATLVSSKMGQYEIIEHHPRDIPPSYGTSDATFSIGDLNFQSRLYYRKIN